MLGKRGVSEVFIGGVRASPRSDGGSKSEIRGYGGSKIHGAYPTLNVGYPRVKGAKDCPFDSMSNPRVQGMVARDATSSRVT